METPQALSTVFHYANARPTEKTWRRIVLGQDAESFVATGQDIPELPPFGVQSLAELEAVLGEFRSFLWRWVALDSVYSEDAALLVREINERARWKFGGFRLSPVSEKLFELWETEDNDFEQLLYANLTLGLKEVSFHAIYRCEAEGCGKFFYQPAKRDWKFCSVTCRNRVTVRRYRERQQATKRRKRPGRPKKRATGAKK